MTTTGEVARKLTFHEGIQMFTCLSPDGKFIAFAGEYNGNAKVYLIPIEGGIPRRMTFKATLDSEDVSD